MSNDSKYNELQKNGWSYRGNPKYELIKSVTLTEEVTSVMFDGFDLQAMYIDMVLQPATVSGNGWFSFRESRTGDTFIQSDISPLVTTDSRTKYARCVVEKRNGITHVVCTKPSIVDNGGAAIASFGAFKSTNKIGALKLYLGSNILFPVGCKFDLWGVRA